MSERDAIFVEDEDVPGPPGMIRRAATDEMNNMEFGAPPKPLMDSRTPYYAAAAAALAVSGSIAYNRLKQSDTAEEEDDEPIVKKSTQRLRGDADYRMDGIDAEDSQVRMVNFGAKLIQEVYKIRNTAQGGLNLLSPLKDVITGERRKYYSVPNDEFLGLTRYDTGNDLAMGFYDEDTFYFAIRGLDIKNDFRDFIQGGTMALKSLSTGDPDDMGGVFKDDVMILEKALLQAVRKYPNKKFVLLGHSRGAGAALVLGRKLNLQTHGYNPASTRGEHHRDYGGYDTSNINIYTTNRDLVPRNLRNTAGFSPETHVNIITQNQDIMFEHGIGHFANPTGWMSLRVRENPLNEFFTEEEDNIILDPFIEEIEYPIQAFSERAFVPNNTFIRDKVENEVIPTMSLDMLDSDGDGIVTYIEFVRYWSKRGYSMSKIKEMFNSLDLNNDNVLDSNEF